MERGKDRDLDDFFKDAMQNNDQHIDFREEDWSAMEQMLDKGRTRPVVIWMRIAGGIAAILLLTLGWWYLNNKQAARNDKAQIAKVKMQSKPQSASKNTEPVDEDSITTTEKQVFAGRTAKGVAGRVVPGRHNPVPVNFVPKPMVKKEEAVVLNKNDTAKTAEILAQNPVARQNDTVAKQPEVLAKADELEEKPSVEKKVKAEAIKTQPVYTLSVLASPDINAVSAFNNSKVGSNVGLMFSATFGKVSVSTGALYAVKPYAASLARNVSYYNKISTVNQDVMADCRVLDIPLNVDYRVYSKQRNSISLGAGLSSYFMLRENYTYTGGVGYNGTQGNSFSVSNQNRHILGVLNLQATYQRQLNPKIGLSIQPFMKLPLTDIGYGQVRLRSAGIAAGLNWNIGKTPK
ncbi:hypothetical protein EOD41_01805 [Mucilaginibacter limnophilus]|uniref:Outer membrane protein beta-barrel domain-containing protein n=1 Tax=Mucilaginibacter limnophilus TaxID=1932778 RepID=A0A437MYL1_9SPHI|nr:hypothetical protein [Mucilaginibacter limnophilus]RVU02699.1 hypothetical protein EOD41_01805 [Mucilaginibacter limnophilus]